MPPQQRLFLEHCWRAIEDAGYRPSELKGQRVGVFVGAQFTDYRELLRERGVSRPQAVTGNAETMIANRVSYFFDFRGPSGGQHRCAAASSRSTRPCRPLHGRLRPGTGGRRQPHLHPDNFVAADKSGMLSPAGRSKSSTRGPTGTCRARAGASSSSSGSKARWEGDHVHALVRGVAGTTAGRPIRSPRQLRVAGGAGLRYLQGAGVSTRVGDLRRNARHWHPARRPDRVDGLKQAFGRGRPEGDKREERHCGLGSVKTNIGHLEPAAGVAGLIKTILSMNHGLLPGNPNLRELNPYLRLDGSPFYVVRGSAAWARPKDAAGNESTLLAGVSSFGFGGSNAHAIVEEAPARRAQADDSASKLTTSCPRRTRRG